MNIVNRYKQRENAFLVFYSNIFINGSNSFLTNENEMKSILQTIKPEEDPDQFFYEVLTLAGKKHAEVQQKIQQHLKGWRIERLAKIDYALLMLGTTELLYLQEKTPLPVVCNEYVELSKRFGHADSPTFINATLEQLGKIESV